MRDPAFLQWPFFDARHSEFAARMRVWPAQRSADCESGDADTAVKTWVRDLAASNFLQACLDLDVRTLCIARELLAYHDGLADFAFAMQGLGSAPLRCLVRRSSVSASAGDIASGSAVAAFALSEREAGSDVAAIATRRGERRRRVRRRW